MVGMRSLQLGHKLQFDTVERNQKADELGATMFLDNRCYHQRIQCPARYRAYEGRGHMSGLH
eukprot:4115253-Heterocapsa_arctica.AAC.1